MYLEPYNRHLLVLPNFKEEEGVSFVLPDDYKKPQDPYIICEVLGIASDCNINLNIADKIVIERSMLQEIKTGEETNYLILENYVYGRLQG
jgi:hypothetical protein|tara:strand:+ start:242 stop:514 length:273 start_codon:yes stop_codon:yes gene_type:complete